jgi:hypothetical protein
MLAVKNRTPHRSLIRRMVRGLAQGHIVPLVGARRPDAYFVQ